MIYQNVAFGLMTPGQLSATQHLMQHTGNNTPAMKGK
jgi:hypothetical protein